MPSLTHATVTPAYSSVIGLNHPRPPLIASCLNCTVAFVSVRHRRIARTIIADHQLVGTAGLRGNAIQLFLQVLCSLNSTWKCNFDNGG